MPTRITNRAFMGLLMLFLVNVNACKKEMIDKKLDPNLVPATIHNTGSIVVDGCGWLIETSNTWYSPVNLDAEFKIDQLKVLITYEIQTDNFVCGLDQTGISKISLTKIQKE